MHHSVNLVLREDGFKRWAIRKIDLAEDGGRRYGGTMALQQAIQGNDRQAARDQHFRADTPDVARGAGNENIHL